MKHRYAFPIYALLAIIALAGCAGTRSAYKAAAETKNPEVYAYVVTEHYSALVHEATTLKASGALTGSALAAVQKADAKAKPLVIGDANAVPPKAGVEQLAKAYSNTRSAEDEAALQSALNAAVVAVSDFINALKGVGQ